MDETVLNRPLRVLVVEDSANDAELLVRELGRGGYEVSYERVLTAEAMRTALAKQPWDLVIADYALPEFSALAALDVLKESGLDLPFIIVSGTVGEETAVVALKAGAHDFMLKGHLARLFPAIDRELREVVLRRERREALAQVQESERRLSAIFNQAAVGIAQIDLQGRFIEVNQCFCDLVKRPMSEVLTLRVHDLTHPEDVTATSVEFEQIEKGERSLVLEKRYSRPDGTHIWVTKTVTVVTDPAGVPMYSVAIVQDISDLKQAIRARDEFLSIASHELKTPITALELQLASALDLLLKRAAPHLPIDKVVTKLDAASRQVDRITVLINSLLDVTRITSGRFTLSRRKTDLRDVVEGVLTRLHELVRRSGSKVSLTADRAVVGEWDPVGLETLVANLLTNALKFGEGGPIEITVGAHENAGRLAVTDHGVGIAAEDQARIFQRFERAVPSQHYGGFGIGLWVSRQVVEAHGGSIRVTSTKGAGSTFTVELPLGREGNG